LSALEHAAPLLKLDLGAGKNKREGFTAVDIRPFDGVDVVADLTKPWPWDDNSVAEVHASHFLEHLTGSERVHFMNELYRVLVPNGRATIITPHWASNRAYGDVTHQWPPVSEMFYYYLSKEWRAQNAPHNDFYTCDFAATWGYSTHPSLAVRNQEYQSFAVNFYKEAAQDLIATLTKK
jgi:SAM-dependent methyltransferase